MFFKFVVALLWAAVMLVAMCTYDPEAFLYDQVIKFKINLSPNFSNLLILSEIHLDSSFYLLQKGGHILSFGILYILLLGWTKRKGRAFTLCLLFALFTEVLQLFFQRTGRLFDVGVDLIGVILAYGICEYVKNKKKAIRKKHCLIKGGC